MDKEKIIKQADWSIVEKRPTWGTVTSAELARVFKVPLTSINNWLVRNKLPAPEPRRKGGGNKNRWKVSTVKNWLYGTPEDEIHWVFINEHMAEGFESIEQAMWNAERYWRAYGVDRSAR